MADKKRILIFGAGRVGGAMAAYARYLGADALTVTHAEASAAAQDPAASKIAEHIAAANVVAAAIPDSALAHWLETWGPLLGATPAIHFSGALTIEGMKGYHPLYSFPPSPLAPEKTATIAIGREAGAAPFAEHFPGAPNPELVIAAEDRAFYHALAVLSGNFAAHLWNETAKAFAERFGAPPETIMASYLAGVVDRFREAPTNSLTGPAARRDAETVAANLAALAENPRLEALYQAFLASAWPDWRNAAQEPSGEE